MKLILAILLSLSLIGIPGVASAAPKAACTMADMDQDMAADHEKMGCCAPTCAVPAPAAVLPDASLGGEPVEPIAGAYWPPAGGNLSSMTLQAEDPPPRTGSA